MNNFQRDCLVAAATHANRMATLALDAEASGDFDAEAAGELIMQQLGAVAAGFDDEMDHATLQRVISGCGLATRPVRGVPANDQIAPGGAA